MFRFSWFLLFAQIIYSQMVVCPEGSFTMGSGSGSADEQPVHTVEISRFSISKTEVTEAQYDSCVQSGKCTPAHYNDRKCVSWNGSSFVSVNVPEGYRDPGYPVVCVNWHQAKAYCQSKGMILPTEAQWEYAAGTQRRGTYSWGNTQPSSKNCTMAGCGHPDMVGKYPPNEWGIHDMTGNAWEWTADFYEREYYAQSLPINPVGPDAGLYRVIRGGGWYSTAGQLAITNRHWFAPEYAEVSLGFRCVKKND